ncbi:UNVERIFIED_CONTAM: hypothetical protein FKN15_049491 [Acipenser sinensis]
MEEEEIAAGAVPGPESDRNKQRGVGDWGSYSAALPGTELHKTGSSQGAAHGDNTGSGTLGRGIRSNMKRNGSRSCVTPKSRFGSRERDWLKEDPRRGCVFLHGGGDPQPPCSSGPPSSSTSQSDLRLVLCTTDTTAAELCAQGDSEGLYLQLHGDLIRRLDPSERPLQIVYDYLAAMGFEDPFRIQNEAANSDLSCMMRFYSDKLIILQPSHVWQRSLGDQVLKKTLLDPSERPLQIVYDYLAAMGFEDPFRIQNEAANSDLSCMMRFYSEKPCSADQLERILLKGVFSVRKGKTQLHKWAERQVILCGTCLIVASVKDSLTGKMHILPLVGGKVEEVKRRQHCLMFSSAGPQAQTCFVNFDSQSDYQRWYRQASKVVSQTVSVVDLSCYSLEEVPECLFYSQDITHLNLRNNFMRPDRTEGLHSLNRFSQVVSQTVSVVDLSCYSLEEVPECLFYSQDITHLNLRNNFMRPDRTEGLHSLNRFSQVKSLNLSHNRLGSFPESLCEILTLTELNLSCNGIRSLPAQIENLHSLQTLSLDGNHLSLLPELGGLSQLTSLGLSFNNFSEIPAVLEMLSAVDRLAMAGNCLEILDLGTLSRMSHFKHIDLRLNGLKAVVSGGVETLKHITHMDLRHNRLSALDLSSACSLEQLHCQRNSLGMLTLSGFALRALHTSANHLMNVNIYPVPNQLTYLDLSRNLLEYLPDWVCDTRKIEVLDVSHNLLTELPGRLLSSLSLRKLLAGHNQLHSMPDLLDHIPLEALDLQHNKLGELPESLFYKALNLRYVNVSANSLETVPPSSQSQESLSVLQELYLTSNNLNEQCAALLAGHQNLRVLHIAYNHLQSFPPRVKPKLNPDSLTAQLVDLSCNELTEILLPDLLPPTLQELDLSGNTNLILDHKTLNIFSHIATLKLDQKPLMSAGESMGSSTLWNHGYSEMTGQRNKLCVSVLAVDSFGDSVEAAYGIFDGDRNEEVPRLLQCTMGDVLSEEIQHSSIDTVYMSNTFLSSHRKLGMAGQKLGASALLCYIQHNPGDPGRYFSLTLANVGTCQAVLCRDGQPLPLSRVFSLEQSAEETERVKLSKAIITEDNKVSGVTCCSRLLGCSYLSPWVLPKPWVRTETLCAQDEFLILGNRALFELVSYQEAVCTVQAVRDPQAAAKKLCTLAQSYGCRDNVGALVVSLHIGEDSCTCELPLATAAGGGGGRIYPTAVPLGDPANPSTSSGVASEFNSEMSASEVGSEAGSIASNENPAAGLASRPECRCSFHPTVCGIGGFGGNNLGLFQRQPSCATFSSNQSDNGLDSDDEAPLDGVISNGSKLEVEVDIHCCAFRVKGGAPEGNGGQETVEERRGFALRLSEDIGSCVTAGFGCRMRRQNSVVVAANGWLHSVSSKETSDLKKCPSTSSLFGKKLSNGSVVTVEESHNLIEVALEAPKKKSGYFAAPAQQDPEDQLVVPPGLEQDVWEQLRHLNPNPGPPPTQPAPTTGDPDWDHPHLNSQQQQLQQPWDASGLALQQEYIFGEFSPDEFNQFFVTPRCYVELPPFNDKVPCVSQSSGEDYQCIKFGVDEVIDLESVGQKDSMYKVSSTLNPQAPEFILGSQPSQKVLDSLQAANSCGFNSIDCQHSESSSLDSNRVCQDMDMDGASGSLGQRERKKKKKRPPGYYNYLEGSSSSSSSSSARAHPETHLVVGLVNGHALNATGLGSLGPEAVGTALETATEFPRSSTGSSTTTPTIITTTSPTTVSSVINRRTYESPDDAIFDFMSGAISLSDSNNAATSSSSSQSSGVVEGGRTAEQRPEPCALGNTELLFSGRDSPSPTPPSSLMRTSLPQESCVVTASSAASVNTGNDTARTATSTTTDDDDEEEEMVSSVSNRQVVAETSGCGEAQQDSTEPLQRQLQAPEASDADAKLAEDLGLSAAPQATSAGGTAANPPAKSWASLFHNSKSSPRGPVAYVEIKSITPSSTATANSPAADQVPGEIKESPVHVSEDPMAPKLAGINSVCKGFIPCFCNCCTLTLQAVIACPPMYHLMKSIPMFSETQRPCTSTPMIDNFVRLVNEFSNMPVPSKAKQQAAGDKIMKDVRPGIPFEPTYIYTLLTVIKSSLSEKGRQEDAEEFLGFILNGLHEEMLSLIKLISPQEEQDSTLNGPDSQPGSEEKAENEEGSEDEWEQVGPKNKTSITRQADFIRTPITDVFGGHIRSVVYQQSSKESVTLQPFFSLQLDIQSEKIHTVQEALETLVARESVQGYTTKSKQEVEISRRVTLEELPPVLVLHLKRFVYEKTGGCQKLIKNVEYPVDLEISKDLLSPGVRSKIFKGQRSYRLFAVVYHHGNSATGGHYTTDVFHIGLNGWLRIDDQAVKVINQYQVVKQTAERTAYLLYYRRVDLL